MANIRFMLQGSPAGRKELILFTALVGSLADKILKCTQKSKKWFLPFEVVDHDS